MILNNSDGLDELLFGDNIFTNPSESPIIQKPKEFANFKKVETRAKSRAKKTIKGLVKNYLSPDMLDDDYLKLKVGLDIDRLTDVLYVLETSKWAITCLMEEIDSGSKRSIDFDALSKLQRQNLETMKTEKGLRQILEDEYKRFADNFVKKDVDGSPQQLESSSEVSGNIRTRGHKALVDMLQKAKADIEESNKNDEDLIVVTNVTQEENETV